MYYTTPHPDYKPPHRFNDIGIVHLLTETVVTDYVKPICLWDPDKTPLSEVVGEEGVVVGWGNIETGRLENYLQREYLPVISNERCIHRHEKYVEPLRFRTAFCAGYQNGEKKFEKFVISFCHTCLSLLCILAPVNMSPSISESNMCWAVNYWASKSFECPVSCPFLRPLNLSYTVCLLLALHIGGVRNNKFQKSVLVLLILKQ